MALLLALFIMDNKTSFMKFAGATLIIAGILMTILFGGNFTKEEKMADTDPVETTKEENKMLEWPMYGGALAVVAGVIIITLGKRKRK